MPYFKLIIAIFFIFSLNNEAVASSCQDFFKTVIRGRGTLKVTLEEGIIRTSVKVKGSNSNDGQVIKDQSNASVPLDESAITKLKDGETLFHAPIAVNLNGTELVITSVETGDAVLRVPDFEKEVLDRSFKGKITTKGKFTFREDKNENRFAIGSAEMNSYDGTTKVEIMFKLNLNENSGLITVSKTFTPFDSRSKAQSKTHIELPLDESAIKKLRRGEVLYSGFIAVKQDGGRYSVMNMERPGTAPIVYMDIL